jgi:Calcium-dependent channel, 7TM region, putative phosphate
VRKTLGPAINSNIVSVRTYPNYEKLYELFEKRNKLFYKLEKLDLNDHNSRLCSSVIRNQKKEFIKGINKVELDIGLETRLYFNKNIGYAFVFCDSFDTAKKALKEPSVLELSLAPADKDIVWEYLNLHKGLSIFKRLFCNIIFILFFLVLLTPLTLSSLISDILKDLSLDVSFGSQSLSSFILSLFQYAIVPYIIKLLVDQELHYLKSEAASSRIFKYLLYTIMNIIIFPLIGTVTLTVFLQNILNTEILELNVSLAKNIGKVGDFFVNFVISMGFVSNILDLLSLSNYFIGKISQWQAVTLNEEKKAALAPEFDFAHEYSKVLTVFAVVLVFSISTPLILPFGAFYMFIKYFVDKYNLLFAYRISKVEGLSTQKSVITSLLIISSLFQSINSGLFIVSGMSALIWLGGILTGLSVVTFIFSIVFYKYWDSVQSFSLSKHRSYNHDYDSRYIHPCQSIVSDYKKTYIP